MKLSELKDILKMIEECDDEFKAIDGWTSISNGMRNCYKGAIIERRSNLAHRLHEIGVDVEV